MSQILVTASGTFAAFNALVDFDDAEAICANSGLVLAKVVNDREFEEIKLILSNVDAPFFSSFGGGWLGLRRIRGGASPSDFELIDDIVREEDNDFMINKNRGQFPWRFNEPNNFFGEDCGEIDLDEFLNDFECQTDNNIPVCSKRTITPIQTSSGKRFELIRSTTTFDQAIEICESRNLVLSKITNQQDFQEIQAILQTTRIIGEEISLWFGSHINFINNNLIGQVNEPALYSFLDIFQDVQENDFIFKKESGEFPWASNQPNGFVSGDECVLLSSDDEFQLSVGSCSDTLDFLLCSERTELVDDFIEIGDFNLKFQLNNFDESTNICEGKDLVLAQIINEDDFIDLQYGLNEVFKHVLSNGIADAWVGITQLDEFEREEDIDLNQPISYRFNDLFANDIDEDFIFNKLQGEFPWDNLQPDNDTLEPCVELGDNGNGITLSNEQCLKLNFALCSVRIDTRVFQTSSGKRFELIRSTTTFDQAIEICESRNLVLSKITNQQDFQEIQAILQTTRILGEEISLWFGSHINFINNNLIGEVNEPALYSFLDIFQDVQENDFIFKKESGEFPWAPNQPNGLVSGDECVLLSSDDEFQLSVGSCSDTLDFLLCSERTELVDDFIQIGEFNLKFQLNNFDESTNICEGKDLVLAQIINEDDFIDLQYGLNEVFKHVLSNGIADAWVGIRQLDEFEREEDIDLNQPISYRFNDLFANDINEDFIFNKSQGELPWDNLQPDNDTLEPCVELGDNGNGITLSNEQCLKLNFALCSVRIDKGVFQTESGKDFFLYSEPTDFEQAKDICEGDNLVLASVIDEDDFLDIVEALKRRLTGSNLWIGAERADINVSIEERTDPSFFSFVDTTFRRQDLLFLFDRDNGEFPWNENRPNQVGLEVACVEINKETGFLLDDEDCTVFKEFLCSVPIVDLGLDEDNNEVAVYIFLTAAILSFILMAPTYQLLKNKQNELQHLPTPLHKKKSNEDKESSLGSSLNEDF